MRSQAADPAALLSAVRFDTLTNTLVIDVEMPIGEESNHSFVVFNNFAAESFTALSWPTLDNSVS